MVCMDNGKRFKVYNTVIKTVSIMHPPCELIVREILPAFRSLVAKQLIQKYNFSQIEAAKVLGTTQATVSYYLNAKRGRKGTEILESNSQVQSMVVEFADRIANDRSSLQETTLEFCKICKALKGEDFVCEMHKHLSSVPENCNICNQEPAGVK
ncbi:MAG: transcriptional regulator [Thermoproteota archaeon]